MKRRQGYYIQAAFMPSYHKHYVFPAVLISVVVTILLVSHLSKDRQHPWAHSVNPTLLTSFTKLQDTSTTGHLSIFVGIQTSTQAKYAVRRKIIRQTWVKTCSVVDGAMCRFVVGHSDNTRDESIIRAEEQLFHDIYRLPVTESYWGLANKTRYYFWSISVHYPQAKWIIKLDDDVYVFPSRLLLAVRSWQSVGAGYVGCFRYDGVRPKVELYDHLLFDGGHNYPLRARGSAYALSADVVRKTIVRNFEDLRLLQLEDSSVGIWLLGTNVLYLNDERMCSPTCTGHSVVISVPGLDGLRDPINDMLKIEQNTVCQSQVLDPENIRPLLAGPELRRPQ